MTDRPSLRMAMLVFLATAGAVLGVYLITVQGFETITRRLSLGNSFLQAVLYYLSFLSILANAALVAVYAWFLSGGRFLGWARSPTLHAFLAALIVLVGVVWHVLLRPIEDFDFNAIGFHYLAPVIFVAWWALNRRQTQPTYRAATWLMLLPIGYALWLLGRGALTGDYPYGFIDVGEVGYGGALPMMIGLLVAQWLLALALVAVARRRDLVT